MMSETGETLGPYPYSNLHAWYTSEQLAGEQLVARAGMADWVELSTIIIDDELQGEENYVEHSDSNQTEAQEEVYMLDGDGGTIGPYPYSDVVHWFYSGDIDSESWVSIAGGDWESASIALSNHAWDNGNDSSEDSSQDSDTNEHVEAFDDETYDHERASEAASGAVYVNVEGEVQGPYPVEDIQYWLEVGSIDVDNWMSIDGSDWLRIRDYFEIHD